MTSILVTGANGFVGQALCGEAISRGYEVAGATRSACTLGENVKNVVVGTVDDSTDWVPALQGIEVVIHLAARVHVMHDTVVDPLLEFRKVNLNGTMQLARCAAACGVKRFVYVSSIKVNGEETTGGHIYSEQDIPEPQDPYGLSKWEAEQALWRIARETGLEVVIIRPPLVYGAGVKGNFAQMMRAVSRGLPLPFASVRNQRSLIYVGNLVDALIVCITHPAAKGNTFLISDGNSVSTPDLLRAIAHAMGVPCRIFLFPTIFLRLAGFITGKSSQISRLLGDLQVDDDKIRSELNWRSPYSLQEGLTQSVGK